MWGGGDENVYTDDSNLGTAAVHAGALKVGETAMLRFTILPGQDSYIGSTRNDVTTRPIKATAAVSASMGPLPRSTVFTTCDGQDKPPFPVYVVGNLNGTVYGTVPTPTILRSEPRLCMRACSSRVRPVSWW